MKTRKLAVCAAAALAAMCFSTIAVPAETDGSLDLAQFKGKVVVVDFWASWCVPCRRSFPWLNSMHETYGDDGLVIIGVNLDEERAEAEAFLEEYPAKFRIHFDESKELAHRFDVVGMPSSYVLGRDGEVVTQHIGFKVRKQEEYEAAIVKALGITE
jgi:thiol-disulfide isomerase/thioredoxin